MAHGGFPPYPAPVHHEGSGIPRDLRDQVLELLSEMSIVAEAPAANLHQGRSSASKPGSRAPVSDGDDLFTKWSQRFAVQTDPGRVRTLILLARRELDQRRVRKPTHESEDNPGQRETEREMEGRIIAWFRGVPSVEAAAYESASGSYCSPQFIHRVRRKNDCDPETGIEIEPPERRVRRVLSLKAAGYNQTKIAKELDVHKSTVSRILRAAESGHQPGKRAA